MIFRIPQSMVINPFLNVSFFKINKFLELKYVVSILMTSIGCLDAKS